MTIGSPFAGERPYEVLVGTCLATKLPALAGDQAPPVVLIRPRATASTSWRGPPAAALRAAGLHTVHAEAVPPGEAAKESSVATPPLVPPGS